MKNFDLFKVKKSRLDDVLINKVISFIKIDVEGHEKEVIDGSINIIKKYKPTLLVEIEKRHNNKPVHETIDYINALGYKSYYLENNNLIDTTKLKNIDTVNNFIFLSKKKR